MSNVNYNITDYSGEFYDSKFHLLGEVFTLREILTTPGLTLALREKFIGQLTDGMDKTRKRKKR